MTKSQLAAVAKALGHRLPRHYQKFVLAHSSDLQKIRSNFYRRPEDLIENNQIARQDAATYFTIGPDNKPFPTNYFVIGDNGGGDFWFVFRNAADLGLWFYECESHEIVRRHDSLEAYLADALAEHHRELREPATFRRPGSAVPDPWFRIPTKEGRELLAKRLGVTINPPPPYTNYWEWDVYAPKSLKFYSRLYHDRKLTDDARYSLVEILAHELEHRRYVRWERLTNAQFENTPDWREYSAMLRANPRLHACTMYYWSCFEAKAGEATHALSIPMCRVWTAVESSLVAAKG